MNESETGDSTEKSPISIIKPWLSVVLIVSIIGGVAISASLIIKLSKHQSALDEASALRVKIDEANKNIVALETKRLDLREDLNLVGAVLEDYKEKKNELDSINSELTLKSEQVGNLKAELKGLGIKEVTLGTLEKDIEKNKKQQSVLMKEIFRLKHDLKDAEEAERRYQAAKKDEDKSIADLKTLNGDIERAKKSRLHSVKRKEELEGQLENMSVEITAKTNELARLDKLLAGKKPEAKKIDDGNKELNDLNDHLRFAENKKESLDAEVAKLELEVEKLNEKKKPLEDAQNKLNAINQRHARFEGMLLVLEEQLKSYGARTNKLAESRATLDKIRPELNIAKGKLKEAQDAEMKSTMAVDILKVEKETLIKDKNELIQETNRLKTDKAAYQNSIEAFNADIGKLKSQKQTLLKEIEGLKEKGGGTPPAGGEPEKGGSR